jgi:DNA-binding transcriptional regulator YdaS (Cro superfamily)
VTQPDILNLLIQAIADRNDPQTGQGGQTAVAKTLGCSPALLSQVKSGAVPLSSGLQAKILEFYGTETIDCPELGPTTHAVCAEEKRKPWSTSRHRMFRACKACERSKP